MPTDLEHQIIATLQAIFDQFGWFGVAGMMAFESATTITPSEVILGLAGWMLLAAHDAPPGMIFVGGLYAALGSTLGAAITYWLTRLGGKPVVDLVARWFRLNPRYLERAESQFHRWGRWLVLFGRVLPGVRVLVTIPAGLARMPFFQFLVFTLIGSYVWCTSVIGVSYAVAHEWLLISDWASQLTSWPLAVLGVLAVVGWFARRLIHQRLRALFLPIKANEVEMRPGLQVVAQDRDRRRLGYYFDLPARWRRLFWSVLAFSGGGTALALWPEDEAVAMAECAPLAALPGMAALLYWFNHLVFKAARPDKADLSHRPSGSEEHS